VAVGSKDLLTESMLGLKVRVAERECPGRYCGKEGVAGDCGAVALGVLTWVATLHGRDLDLERVRRIEDFLEFRRATLGRPSKQFMASVEGQSRSWDARVAVGVESVRDCGGINELVEVAEYFPVFRDVERDCRLSEAAIWPSRRCCSSLEKCCRRTLSGSDKNQRASAFETRPGPKQSRFARGRRKCNEAPGLLLGRELDVERGWEVCGASQW
jgi:hypothetical protein